MYTERPSNERQRPLLGAGQFIQPSPEPRHSTFSPSAHDFAAGFPPIPFPSHEGGRQCEPEKASKTAVAGAVSKGKNTSSSNGKTRNTKKTIYKDPGQGPGKVVSDCSPGNKKGVVGGTTGGAPESALVNDSARDTPGVSHVRELPYPRYRDAKLKSYIGHQSGPVTDEGKAAVSHNALKHGGYALPTTGDESFASIEQSLYGRLEPMGQEQRSLVRSIGYEIWRIGNIERTVVELERDIDGEKVSLSQLAAQLDFPFAECYREAMLAYNSEESLRARVHGHLCGEFSDMLDRAARLAKEASSHTAAPNARAKSLIDTGREILARQYLIQNLEEEFFEEFDAVMLDARLGRSSLHPSEPEQMHAGWMLPLVECWVYRNFRQIRITESRLKASLRMDLMTSPSIERALKSATARLGLLLSDYRDCRPDVSSRRLHMLGYGPSRAAP
jgi:hypothetical protein